MNSCNILLSSNYFNQEEVFNELKYILKPGMRVLILPFSYDYEWIPNNYEFEYRFSDEIGTHYKELIAPFYDYGIFSENIYIVNVYKDSREFVETQMMKSDIIYLTGGDPRNFLKLRDKYYGRDFVQSIQNFPGIVMGFSAGAMAQLDEYLLYPYECDNITEFSIEEGLNLVSENIDILVHYNVNNIEYKNALIANHHLRPYIDRYYKLEDGMYLIFYH